MFFNDSWMRKEKTNKETNKQNGNKKTPNSNPDLKKRSVTTENNVAMNLG